MWKKPAFIDLRLGL
ncbi:pyrroloquinoline quinone precursor peptide PqqA [Klebsiella pneumoniae]